MIANAGVIAAVLAVALAAALVCERRRRRAIAESARLRAVLADRAESRAEVILARHGLPPLPRRDPVSHRLPAAQPAAASGWLASPRARPRLVGAAVAAMLVVGLVAAPAVLPTETDQGQLAEPPAAGVPMEHLPVTGHTPVPDPEVEPVVDGDAPDPAAPGEEPERERVAVTEPAPEPQPADPEPAPAPAPEPEPDPSPAPEPEPEPSPEPPPPEPPEDGDDGDGDTEVCLVVDPVLGTCVEV